MSATGVAIRFDDDRNTFEPGESLRVTCDLTERRAAEVTAVEWSVYWRTEGKGDEDREVHTNTAESADDVATGESPRLTFDCRLPASPLSYDGLVVRIRWFVAAKVKFFDGDAAEAETEFRLGHVAPAQEVMS
jgi:hypothetical protein